MRRQGPFGLAPRLHIINQFDAGRTHYMLEQYTKSGMQASCWLPSAEGGQGGTGKEISVGVEDVKGGHKYLPFVKNGINYVETQGKDVISYNFTGCIMATYVTATGS